MLAFSFISLAFGRPENLSCQHSSSRNFLSWVILFSPLLQWEFQILLWIPIFFLHSSSNCAPTFFMPVCSWSWNFVFHSHCKTGSGSWLLFSSGVGISVPFREAEQPRDRLRNPFFAAETCSSKFLCLLPDQDSNPYFFIKFGNHWVGALWLRRDFEHYCWNLLMPTHGLLTNFLKLLWGLFLPHALDKIHKTVLFY